MDQLSDVLDGYDFDPRVSKLKEIIVEKKSKVDGELSPVFDKEYKRGG